MADIKTNLRELSAGVGVRLLLDSKDLPFSIEPKVFFEYCKKVYNLDFSNLNLKVGPKFLLEQKQIIANGFNLASKIVKIFKPKADSKITWLGGNNHSGMPIDLQIGELLFSLKEESFILENMGLYKYLNLITGSNFNQGLHIFKQFAPKEYEAWFNYTWNYLIKNKKTFVYKKNDYKSQIKFSKGAVELKVDYLTGSRLGYRAVFPRQVNLGWDKFMEYTDGRIREKVFAKWIKDNLERNLEYLKIKKIASEKAGENLKNFILQGVNNDMTGIKRFLQIYEKEYYYAKTTRLGVNIYKVPTIHDFGDSIKIKSIHILIPQSQLNLYTVIENTKAKTTLELRNEIRFSHGQFNGTPEAKMYYAVGQSLETIYEKVA